MATFINGEKVVSLRTKKTFEIYINNTSISGNLQTAITSLRPDTTTVIFQYFGDSDMSQLFPAGSYDGSDFFYLVPDNLDKESPPVHDFNSRPSDSATTPIKPTSSPPTITYFQKWKFTKPPPFMRFYLNQLTAATGVNIIKYEISE